MDKKRLLADVLRQLQDDLDQAQHAALVAHEAATHEESIAENKYDTLGLEAAYLASGQARRVDELRQTLITWGQLQPRAFVPERGIELGALVQLLDEQGTPRWLFLGPPGASIRLNHDGVLVQVLGSGAPLGRALLGKGPGDEVELSLPSGLQRCEVLEVR
ncbi:GreA/GreB family elongation factor [Pseudomonas sp. NCCP-436]|uniref:GreA/GreB family elongation factor n=1 Tax=Pseudomonas sp. NCCP-436 TaxID=2842481 RepID=UPI001C7E569E|nr:GreA/GreB family elongation factor [Pseudomonas sp. NCCP-436]GIZ10951.1 hypothetical protein NCCP436_03670 [Pseudomonas sp. NCCP-436]